MAYNNYFPQGYQPYPYQYPQVAQQVPQNIPQNIPQAQNNNGVIWVQGMEGAKAHPINPGQSVLLMDSEGDCFYLKSADQSGMPTMRVFDYTERKSGDSGAKTADLSGFISKDELLPYATKEDLKTAILDLKQELTEKKGKKKDE